MRFPSTGRTGSKQDTVSIRFPWPHVSSSSPLPGAPGAHRAPKAMIKARFTTPRCSRAAQNWPVWGDSGYPENVYARNASPPRLVCLRDVGGLLECYHRGAAWARSLPRVIACLVDENRILKSGSSPNPFNPSTAIWYDVPANSGDVTLRVFDVSGRFVRTLVDGQQAPGRWMVTWDGRDAHGRSVSTGIYFYRLEGGGFSATKKMLLLK